MRSLTPTLGGLTAALAIDPFWSSAFSAVLVLVGVIVTAVLTTRTSRRASGEAKAARTTADNASDRLAALEAVLATHEKWDQQVFGIARRVDPSFPSPPPLTLGNDPSNT